MAPCQGIVAVPPLPAWPFTYCHGAVAQPRLGLGRRLQPLHGPPVHHGRHLRVLDVEQPEARHVHPAVPVGLQVQGEQVLKHQQGHKQSRLERELWGLKPKLCKMGDRPHICFRERNDRFPTAELLCKQPARFNLHQCCSSDRPTGGISCPVSSYFLSSGEANFENTELWLLLNPIFPCRASPGSSARLWDGYVSACRLHVLPSLAFAGQGKNFIKFPECPSFIRL